MNGKVVVWHCGRDEVGSEGEKRSGCVRLKEKVVSVEERRFFSSL